MSPYLSDKIKLLSFAAIILVLYIHSGFHADEIAGMAMNDYVQIGISHMIGRLAVPLFFVISGYLFFLKVPDGMKSIYEKMRKRVRTLFVPYVIGCLFFIAFLTVIAITPATTKFCNGNPLTMLQASAGETILKIFWGTGGGQPMAFQLWFLRNLILMVATAPIWYICLKRLGWLFVAIVLALTFSDYMSLAFSLFWFILGGKLVDSPSVGQRCEQKAEDSTQNTDIKLINKENSIQITFQTVSGCLYIAISVIELIFPDIIDWSKIKIPTILLGLVGIWRLYDAIVGKEFKLSEHKKIATACHFTFFIYLFHEPTLNIIRKIIVAAIGKTSTGFLVSYLLSPWLFALCAIAVGIFLEKYCSTVYKVCTGGR